MTKSLILKLLLVFGGILIIVAGVCYAAWRILFGGSTAVDPSSTGGEQLVGTDDIQPSGDQNFSVSPNGQWLFYPSDKGIAFEPVFVLYNIQERERHEIGLSPKVRELSAEGSGPLKNAGCWSPNGSQVFLPGSFPHIAFFVDVETDKPQIEVIENVDEDVSSYFNNCPTKGPDVTSVVNVQQPSESKIYIVDAQNPSKTLARHKKGVTISKIWIQNLTLSPDGQQIAYEVVERPHVGFGTSNRIYILRIDSQGASESRLLTTSPLGPIRWSPDSRFVYAAVVPEKREESAIYRWEVD